MAHYFWSTRTALILLLLSLIALENTIALSQRDTADFAAYKLNNVMLDEEPSGVKISKWKRSGRKMAMDQVNTAALNTGDAKSSSSEPSLQSSRTEEISNDLKDKQGHKGVRVTIRDRVQVAEQYSSRHESLMSSSQVLSTSEKQKLIEGGDEVFKLLNRDYDLRPRRHPPVHN